MRENIDVFECLGKLRDKITIKLNKDAIPK